jgi:SpoVK/Ycf46/Vps4 family AAA+-type ATPase
VRKILSTEHVDVSSIDLKQVALETNGASGSDLSEIVKEAAYIPVREALEARAARAKRTLSIDIDEDRSMDELVEEEEEETVVRPISTQDLIAAAQQFRRRAKAVSFFAS